MCWKSEIQLAAEQQHAKALRHELLPTGYYGSGALHSLFHFPHPWYSPTKRWTSPTFFPSRFENENLGMFTGLQYESIDLLDFVEALA